MIISSQAELDKEIKLKHFQLSELECHHCHIFPLSTDSLRFILLLEEFRAFLSNIKNKDIPLILTNCYRCPFHNEKVGGSPSSAHTQAIAADVFSTEIKPIDLFYLADLFSEFSGIGIYWPANFVHIDIKRRQLKKQYWVNISGKETPFDNFKAAYDFYLKSCC